MKRINGVDAWQLLGVAAIVTGAGMVYLPAAPITLGVGLILYAEGRRSQDDDRSDDHPGR